MRVTAAILAAGKGERFGSDKCLQPMGGRPVWRWSYDTLLSCPEVDRIGLVCSASNLEALRESAEGAAFVVEGGSSRQGSVRQALLACGDADLLVLHDAARPFATAELFRSVIDAAKRTGAAAPGIAVRDTIRKRDGDGLALLDRSSLVAMQTPQAVSCDILRRAFQNVDREYTDDVALAESIGVKPVLVPGEESNVKVTFPTDLPQNGEVRTGIGYDVHAFSRDPDRRLFLGCVEFPEHRGLEGHSDADVLAHAVVDALLGAASLGDIGTHFPPTDAQWLDRASRYFLSQAGLLLNRAGWRILNIDATVIAESPKVMSRAVEMRHAISTELQVSIDRVSIKATTNERMGFIGREEGIASLAIATIAAA